MITFTKNKDTDEFDIIGPAEELIDAYTAIVAKADGSTTKVRVGRASKPFIAKFGPNKGKEVVIAKCYKFTPKAYAEDFEEDDDEGYCYHRCPVRKVICNPENGPCHDCLG